MIFPIALPQIFTMISCFSFAYILIPFFIQILNGMQQHHPVVEDYEVVIIHFFFPSNKHLSFLTFLLCLLSEVKCRKFIAVAGIICSFKKSITFILVSFIIEDSKQ